MLRTICKNSLLERRVSLKLCELVRLQGRPRDFAGFYDSVMEWCKTQAYKAVEELGVNIDVLLGGRVPYVAFSWDWAPGRGAVCCCFGAERQRHEPGT